MHVPIGLVPSDCRDVGLAPRFRAMLVGLSALIATGCGGERETSRMSGSEAPAPISVCDLLTREEVASVLQSPVDNPREQVLSPPAADRAGIAECTYEVTDVPNSSVSIFLRQSPIGDNHPASVRETLTSAGTTVTDIADLGDEAFWDGAKLHVFAGRHVYFTIGVPGRNASKDPQASAMALARTALEKMPGARK